MGDSWVVPPATRRLILADGDWILVKDRLNAGEYRAHLRRSSTIGDDGARRIDLMDLAVSRLVAYLVDWSGDPPIRGASETDLRAALDAIDPEQFSAISAAVVAHEAAMDADRAKKKTAMTTGADPILPSPSDADGSLTGSAS